MSKAIKTIEKIGFQWGMDSPFLACMHHQDQYPAGNEVQGPAVSLEGRRIGNDFSGKDGFSMYHGEKVPGFPVHPHRGFETVTIVLEGIVDHFDSKGAEGRYGNGDVQWLTTGAGCQHVEMFPLVHQDKGNPLELFQIWLNLPAGSKFTDPDYKMLWAEEIPVIKHSNEKGKTATIRLIAGKYGDKKSLEPTEHSWAAREENHVGIQLVELEPEAEFHIPAGSKSLNRNLYYYEGTGSITIDGKTIDPSSRVRLSGEDQITVVNGDRASCLLLLEGEPIQEPVAQYGPFVMNTQQEIQEAYVDYQNTRFGGWPWPDDEPVHERETGRFARYPDGRVIKK
ncbi:pirin family protein [Lacrimispora sp.]|uniref:pirin family protein n=1 Tax=Lacrimispora sp. TaxID=2719234 RepID=UPI0039938BEF